MRVSMRINTVLISNPPSSWTRRPEGYFGKLQYSSGSDTRPDAHTLFLQVNLDGSAQLLLWESGRDSRFAFPRKEFFSSIVCWEYD